MVAEFSSVLSGKKIREHPAGIIVFGLLVQRCFHSERRDRLENIGFEGKIAIVVISLEQ
jgi:hypothetical protein